MTREIASIWGSMALPCVVARIEVPTGGRSTMLRYIESQSGQKGIGKDAIDDRKTGPAST